MVADLCLAEGGERHEKFTRMRNLYSIACLVSKDPDPTFAAAIEPCHIRALANHSIENGNISYFNHEVYFFQIQALAEIIPAWRDALAGETTNKAYTKFTAEGGIIGEPKRETRPGTWPTEEIWMRTEGLDVKAAQTQRIVKDAIFQFLRQQQTFADNTGPVSHYDLAWKYDHIVAPLVTHNIGLGALDPTGQNTDAEMRQTVVEFFAALGRAGPEHLQKFCNDHPDIGSDVLEAAAGKGSASRPSTTPDPTPSQFKK